MWYFYALLGPAIWAFLNHLDKYLLGRFFKEDAAAPVLVVFTGFAGIIVAIAILLFGLPVFTLSPRRALAVMAAGALLVASYIPYMIAMQREEASIVASLYRLIPVFVFALSYIVLGETLQPNQIVGGCITIAGAILLVVDRDRKGRGLDLVTLGLMGAACLMNAGTVVIFKSIALHASFWSSAFWEYVGAAVFSLALVGMMPSHRRALQALLGSCDACILVPVTLFGEAFNLVANLAVGFAGLMAPLALVSIVTGLHPLFLLVYGILFTLFFPAFSRERLARRQILQKAAAIGVMFAGIATAFIA